MKIEQKKYAPHKGWKTIRTPEETILNYDLVFVFGSTALVTDSLIFQQIKETYPNADIVSNSTAGEIVDVEVSDETISLTAIKFETTKIKAVVKSVTAINNSFDCGYRLASEFEKKRLKNVIVISDGHIVNGTELVLGIQEFLPKETIITGGLAGDGNRFQNTFVGLNDVAAAGNVVAIGFYSDVLTVTYGSVGGWDPFGPERLITKSDANILYELDDKPALDTYKLYLGDYAKDLPSSALLFPLSIRTSESENSIVRTILSVNEEEKSLTFAGNMPKGTYARLMKADFDRLIEGSSAAAQNSIKGGNTAPSLAILISCVGRKLVLDQRVEEEIEVIRAVYGNKTAITGFYSYGEISPLTNFMKCELHNQTMTITTLTENDV